MKPTALRSASARTQQQHHKQHQERQKITQLWSVWMCACAYVHLPTHAQRMPNLIFGASNVLFLPSRCTTPRWWRCRGSVSCFFTQPPLRLAGSVWLQFGAPQQWVRGSSSSRSYCCCYCYWRWWCCCCFQRTESPSRKRYYVRYHAQDLFHHPPPMQGVRRQVHLWKRKE